MAKKVTNAEYRRMMSARQERIGGRFGSLKPQFRPQTAAPASEVTPELPQVEAVTAPPIGLPQGDADKGALALVLEAQRLAGDVATADSKEAQKILAKIKIIRELAKKAKGDQTVLSAKLDSVISPIQTELKRKASFREFLKEKAEEFRKTLPERIASRIPVVGGVVSQFLRQRRESEDELRELMRGGKKQSKRGGFAGLGGTAVSDIAGLGMTGLNERERQFETTKSASFPIKTIEAIYKEIVSIRKTVDRMAKRGSGSGSDDSSSSILDSMGDRLFGKRSRIGRLFRRGKISAKRLMRGLRGGGRSILSAAGRVTRSAGRGIGRVAGGIGQGVGRVASSIGRGIGGAASAVGRGIGGAASASGGFFSSIWSGAKSLAGKVGEGLSSIKGLAGGISGLGKVVLGAIGPLLETFFAWQEIKSIKSDPNMSDTEKKKQIGNRVGRAIGSVLGSVGASVALGPAGPLVTTAMDMAGIGPGAFGEWLTEQIGSEKMYDLASSIIPPLKIDSDVGAAVPRGAEGDSDSVAAKITAPASPNTTVGKMVSQYSAEQGALGAAKAEAAAGTATAAPTVNNSAVNTRVSNITNNFNDDLKIRNNEPTLKTMQFRTVQM